ncbi:MAG: DUF308 domain-containing protein [Candidatus Heimdallarchaeota archaeon]|nr:DUF308 domain-containing protein [Candidatus Heimdallarchaeota archaeon]
MSELKIKLPLWLKIFDIIAGIVAIGFAVIVFINELISSPFIDTKILIGIAIIIISTIRILNGIFDKRNDKSLRTFKLITGLLVLPIGIITLVWGTLDVYIILSILGLAILLLGIGSIVNGFEARNKVTSYKMSIITYGFILVFLAVAELIFDTHLDAKSLTIIINVAILLLGLRRLIEGLLDYRIFKQPTGEYQ